MSSADYDYAFAGAGLAALSLLHALIESELPPGRVVLIDPRLAVHANVEERTIGFWTATPIGLTKLAQWSWPTLDVASQAGQRRLELGPIHYGALRATRLREAVLAQACASAWTVERVAARVEQIDERDELVLLRTSSGELLRARWAFDSRLDVQTTREGHVWMWQSFDGVHVELPEPAFDPARALFMDLRVEQGGEGLDFGHVLPISPNAALIYRVHIGQQRRDALDLDGYLTRTLGLVGPRILGHERGHLLLTDARFPRGPRAAHVLRIGLAGGRLKPSTGYAFVRMQVDARAIVASLVRHAHPFALPRERARYRWLDGVLLAWLRRYPARGRGWFERLFERVPAAIVFRLLDEQASAWDLLRIMSATAGWGLGWIGLRRSLGLRDRDCYGSIAP